MAPQSQTINIDGIGSFEVRRRTLRVELQIGAEYSRLTEGQETAPGWFRDICEVVATLKTLIRAAPPGWDIDDMDPQDPETFERLHRVYQTLRENEARFRRPTAADG